MGGEERSKKNEEISWFSFPMIQGLCLCFSLDPVGSDMGMGMCNHRGSFVCNKGLTEQEGQGVD